MCVGSCRNCWGLPTGWRSISRRPGLWSVLRGGTIEPHTHRNAQLSAVFYVRTDADNATGELEFQAPEDYFSHVMAIPYKNAALSGGVFAPKQHRLLIFPSDLTHRVTPYEGSSPRYSVSYDLAITTRTRRDGRCACPTGWTGCPERYGPGLRESRQFRVLHDRCGDLPRQRSRHRRTALTSRLI